MSKMKMYADAEKLFLHQRMSPKQIARHLQISRRTIYYWKKRFNWDKKLDAIIKNNRFFSEELQEFVLNLMKNITENIDKNEPTNSAMLYSITNLLKNMPKLQKYENTIKKENKQQKFELTQDAITKIKQEFLK